MNPATGNDQLNAFLIALQYDRQPESLAQILGDWLEEHGDLRFLVIRELADLKCCGRCGHWRLKGHWTPCKPSISSGCLTLFGVREELVRRILVTMHRGMCILVKNAWWECP